MAKALAQASVIAVCVFLAIFISGCSVQNQQESMNEEFFNYTAYFCAERDCLQDFATQLKSATSTIRCALYGINENLLSDLAALRNITAEIVVDKNSRIPAAYLKTEGGFVVKRDSKGIVHDKYCILDNTTVLTGSFNPTAAAKNDYNNILIINSTSLAAFYSRDFERLKQGKSGKTPTAAAATAWKAKRKAAMLNSTLVEVYFCPQDNCADAVEEELGKANSSIIFAAYSFTSAGIANELVLKSSEGVAVSGIIEKSTTGSEYSKHAMLAANIVNVKLESSKRLMHHKFFIIDGKTVITGSFNPTENADKRNDENIIIIENAAVAEEYAAEFHRIYGD